jgi:hypothetical protein
MLNDVFKKFGFFFVAYLIGLLMLTIIISNPKKKDMRTNLSTETLLHLKKKKNQMQSLPTLNKSKIAFL